MRAAADRGTAVLVVSDELDDLRDCDRVLADVPRPNLVAELDAGWDDRSPSSPQWKESSYSL